MNSALKNFSYIVASAFIGFMCGATMSDNVLVGLGICTVFIFLLIYIYAISEKLYDFCIGGFEEPFSEYDNDADIQKSIGKPFVFESDATVYENDENEIEDENN